MRSICWLFPVVFAIHDLEEIIAFESFFQQFCLTHPSVPLISDFAFSTRQFSVTVLFLFIGIAVVCYLVAKRPTSLSTSLLRLFLFVFFANQLSHLLQSFILKTIVPGAVTAILVGIPFSLYSVKVLITNQLLTAKTAFLLLIAGFVLQIPFAVTALVIGCFFKQTIMTSHPVHLFFAAQTHNKTR